MENAVEIKELTKKYKDFTLDVSAVIPKGFASALIGANGAGKTTLIDTLCGVTAKTGGEAVYFGNMTDTKGEFSNQDYDDYWYDNRGQRISGYEYSNLKEGKKKNYHKFNANMQFVKFFNQIAEAMIKK